MPFPMTYCTFLFIAILSIVSNAGRPTSTIIETECSTPTTSKATSTQTSPKSTFDPNQNSSSLFSTSSSSHRYWNSSSSSSTGTPSGHTSSSSFSRISPTSYSNSSSWSFSRTSSSPSSRISPTSYSNSSSQSFSRTSSSSSSTSNSTTSTVKTSSSTSFSPTCSPTVCDYGANYRDTDYIYEGCHVETQTHILYPYDSTDSLMTPALCFRICAGGVNDGKRYEYAGLQGGDRCWCSHTTRYGDILTELIEQDKAPAVFTARRQRHQRRDPGKGNPMVVSLDNGSDAIVELLPWPPFDLPIGNRTNSTSSPTRFNRRAKSSLASNKLQVSAATECNTLCSGDSCQYCGSDDFIDVYYNPVIAQSAPIIQPSSYDYTYLGCFDNTEPGPMLDGPSYVDNGGFVPDDCIAFCNDPLQGGQTTFAGLQTGNTCFCGNALSPSDDGEDVEKRRVDDRECDTLCDDPFNQNLFCGGGSSGARVQIYVKKTDTVN